MNTPKLSYWNSFCSKLFITTSCNKAEAFYDFVDEIRKIISSHEKYNLKYKSSKLSRKGMVLRYNHYNYKCGKLSEDAISRIKIMTGLNDILIADSGLSYEIMIDEVWYQNIEKCEK